MTEQMTQTGEETERLRRCMSDLLSLLALPAMWAGGGFDQIARVVLDVLPAMLDADFVYMKLLVDGDRAPVESVWASNHMQATRSREIGAALVRSFGPRISAWPQTARIGIGDSLLSTAQARFGMNGHTGVLVVGSRRTAFPIESERLLLNVAGNQVAIAISEAHLLIEQRRYAAELDKRVAQRTEELAASNRALAEEIAERTRAENDLRRSAAFLAQAQRLSKTGSTWWNVSSGDIVWSDETYRLMAYPRTVTPSIEMTLDRCHPDDFERVAQIIRRAAVQGADVDLEQRLIMPDGAVKHVHVVLQNVGAEASGPVFLGAVTDITERKNAEESLRRSEMLLAAGEQISLMGTFSWRMDTDEQLFSDQLKRIFEFEDGAPVTFDEIAERIHPEDLHLLSEKIDEIRKGTDSPDYEIRLLGRDDRIKFLRVVGRVIRHPEGRFECLGAVQDITERRRAEEARDAVRSELAHLTRVMSLGALTASIAHEVNQPLSGIITNAGTCLRLLASDPPDVAGAVETARRTIRDGNRAADVIARLRALFRKKDAVIEPLDLNEAAQEVVELLWSDLQKTRVQLRLELAGDLPRVAGDRVQLQQVIMNLMRNAMDAMKSIDDRPRRLIVRTALGERDSVCMSIRDSGEGFGTIDPKSLFNAFYTTKHDGMGIGLSVSRSIIESHEGRIWAEPNDEPGSTLVFSLPQHRAAGGEAILEAERS